MHKFLSVATSVILATMLAACGGSAFQGTSSGASGTPASVTVTSSAASIPADGSSSATITAVVKDASNAAVSGVAVSFTASAGNVTAVQATTDSTGTATATLVAGTAAAGASITVTATAGTVSGKTTVTVANTQRTVTLQTDMPQIPSNNSKAATITALVRDASNNFVSGVTVIFSSDSGGLAVTSGKTDASGAAVAVLSTPNDPSNRNITVTATVGTTKATIVIPVVGTSLNLTGP